MFSLPPLPPVALTRSVVRVTSSGTMKPTAIVCAILAAIFAVFAVSSRIENGKLKAKVAKEGKVAFTTSQALDIAQSDLAALEAKLAETTGLITNQTSHIASLQGRLEDLSKMTEQLRSLSAGADLSEQPATWSAEVAAPETVILADEDGRETKSFIFGKLKGSDGLTLGTNATFIRAIGRSLLFRMATGSRAKFDLDEVHPGVLTYLGVDVAESSKAQKVIEEQRKRGQARDAILGQMLASKWSEDAKQRFEQGLRAGEVAAKQAAADAQEHLAQAQSLSAQAAQKAANAAIINAGRPPVQVNVRQTVY